jgi:hypothetical protein
VRAEPSDRDRVRKVGELECELELCVKIHRGRG